MVAHIKPGPTSRVVFSSSSGHIESELAVDGADARDISLMIIGRFDELEDGDQLKVAAQWR